VLKATLGNYTKPKRLSHWGSLLQRPHSVKMAGSKNLPCRVASYATGAVCALCHGLGSHVAAIILNIQKINAAA